MYICYVITNIVSVYLKILCDVFPTKYFNCHCNKFADRVLSIPFFLSNVHYTSIMWLKVKRYVGQQNLSVCFFIPMYI